MKSLYSILILTFFLSSCDEEKTIYVAGHLTDCEGIAPQKCMLIKENKTDDWTFLYETIEGFIYEEGFEYVLKVKISKIKNPPADASDLKYKLIEIIAKEKTTEIINTETQAAQLPIDGSWIVTNITNFENKTGKSPHFTIKEEKISGNTGCNSFGGSLKIDTTGIFKTGMLRMTRMFCNETAELESAFTTALNNTSQYTRENNTLSLFDEQHNKLITATLKVTEVVDVIKSKSESISIRYSATSRGFGSSINLVGNQLTYEIVRPTPKKTEKLLTESELNEILNLVTKLELENVEKLEPPSKAHQYDGAPGGTFIIILGDKTYRTPTFDYGNPPTEIKELVDKLVLLNSK